jgi:predicted phage terminase large subunit-like protein
VYLKTPGGSENRTLPGWLFSSASSQTKLSAYSKRFRSPAALIPYWPQARANQTPPDGDWIIWLLLAGRGFGKTRTIVEWATWKALNMPGSRGYLVASTAADVRDVLIDGESGFLNLPDGRRPTFEASKRRLTWPNGSVATTFSAEKPDRLRGPQSHWAIADELAAWKYPDAWDMLLMGLRLGQMPQIAVATTPRPAPIIRKLVADSTCVVTRGSTYDNQSNLAPAFLKTIISRYEGTRLGRQELNAELLEDVEGALWTLAMIDAHRVKDAPQLRRVVVGVDPKAAVTADSETGVVVAGLGSDGDFYVLEDASLNGSPEQWGRAVVAAYQQNRADRIVPEVNQGGDMVSSVLRAVDARVAIRPVHASRGKVTRAEPIAALYEQGKVHHVGSFSKLEDQMTQWVPGMASPDRMDALVWALTDLMSGAAVETMPNPFYD